MLAQLTQFIVLVAVLPIYPLSYCTADNVYCITPTDATMEGEGLTFVYLAS